MTNQDILKIAMKQSAIDLCADPADFEKSENVIVTSRESEGSRAYLKLPFSCQLTSYGNNIVASTSPELREITEAYISERNIEYCFQTPDLHVLNEALLPYGQKICFMAEYFLPDLNALRPLDCAYDMRILYPKDFADLYLAEREPNRIARRRCIFASFAKAHLARLVSCFGSLSQNLSKMHSPAGATQF